MTSINLASMDRQIAAIQEDVEKEVEDVIRKFYLLMFMWLVKATPVDTGRARNAWMGSTGTPTDEVPDEGADSYPEPAPPTSEAERFRLGMILFIVNNVNYITYLDEGSSQQAPAGMTPLAIANLEAQFG